MDFKAPAEDENYDFDAFIKKMERFAKRNKIDTSTSKGKGDAFELFCATVFKNNGLKIT